MGDRKRELEHIELTITLCDRSRYNNSLWSQFGLSILLDCYWKSIPRRRILFDTGWESIPLLHNMEALGIDLASIDSLVLSHSHYDHTGGLAGFLNDEKTCCQVIAHRSITRAVYGTRGGLHYIGLEPKHLEDLPQRRLLMIEEPVEIYPGIWVTGTIQRRTDFEEPEKGVYVLDKGRLIPDPEHDDMALILDLGEKGIVILTGCSHAGVMNTCMAAKEILGGEKIAGLIGGFHLIDVSTEVRRKTIESLLEFEIGRIYTGHCTGWNAEHMLEDAFGDRCRRFYTGDKISIPFDVDSGYVKD